MEKFERNKNVNTCPDANVLLSTLDSLENSKKLMKTMNETMIDSNELLEMIVENMFAYPGTSLIMRGVIGTHTNLDEIVRGKLISYLHLPKSYADVLNPRYFDGGILFECPTKLSKNIILFLAKQKLQASEIKLEDFHESQNLIETTDESLLDVRMNDRK